MTQFLDSSPFPILDHLSEILFLENKKIIWSFLSWNILFNSGFSILDQKNYFKISKVGWVS